MSTDSSRLPPEERPALIPSESPAGESSAESPLENGSSRTVADPDGPAAAPPRRRRIKIGSQRDLDRLPYMQPKGDEAKPPPASEDLKPADQRPLPTPQESARQEDAAEESARQEDAAEESARGEDAVQEKVATEAAPESLRKTEVAPEVPPEKSVADVAAELADALGDKLAREQAGGMTAELEDEVNAALGGMSLDDLLTAEDTAAAAAGPELESRRRGTVLQVDRDSVFISLGPRREGAIALKHFAEPPKPGSLLEVIVTGYDEEEGLYELTVPGASIDVEDWSDLSEGIMVEAHVTGHNKGGLECEVNHLRAFIPASQISLYRVEDLSEFVDQRLPCLVTEADPVKRNLVLSRRAVLEREEEQARQKLLEELAVGETREGVVRSLRDFGAFVDLGGVDGLVHVSQLSWDRVEHPRDVLQEGQRIKVKIERIDRNKGKISLSYRDTLENPWTAARSKYPEGSVVTGTVSRIAEFGAFVKLEPGVEGLVHVSELSYGRVAKVSHVVSEGQELEVKVLSVDPDAQRISLSLKAVQPVPEPAGQETAAGKKARERRKTAVAKRRGPLKGGLDPVSDGDRFGLKW